MPFDNIIENTPNLLGIEISEQSIRSYYFSLNSSRWCIPPYYSDFSGIDVEDDGVMESD